jgi:hypothetical protein
MFANLPHDWVRFARITFRPSNIPFFVGMATLTVISENYPEATWIRPVGYSLIGCLGVGLVNVGYHWYSDFPPGIALGYLFGEVAAHKQDSLFASLTNDSYSGLRVLPSVTHRGTGVTLALLF